MSSLGTAEICAELEEKLGRSATDKELDRVVESLPEFYDQTQLRRVAGSGAVDSG